MGWGHYPSSAFIVNRRDDLMRLMRTVDEMPYFSEADFRHDPAMFTLECSRPGIGPYSVMASLNGIGLTGYRTLVAHAMEMARQLKERIDQYEFCKVINPTNPGPHVCWWVLPRGRNAKQIFEDLERGGLPAEESERYLKEVRRLFDKREAAMDPAIDARLSFTRSVGYSPHGVNIPAWKAVFFNPKSDRAVIDRIISSIEDVA
jgi:glutamate/tyrosine decarboxylase-like PLP-dependent enzyme